MTLLPYLGAWFAASCIAGSLLGRAIRQSAVVAKPVMAHRNANA